MHHFRARIISLIVFASSLLLGACAPATLDSTPTAGPVTVLDRRGKEISLAAPSQRIVSLAPSNTEILFALGAGGQLVARDGFSDFPAEAQSLPDIGGGFGQLNVEKIVSLNPDLVLAADITPPEQIQQLEDIGLSVFVLGNPKDFDGLFANLNIVARLTSREKEASSLVEKLRARVKAVQDAVAKVSDLPLVFYELDATDVNAPYTAGPGTFIDTLIKMAGGENLGASLEGEWVQVSIEALLTRQPEIIILGDFTWGGVTPEQVASRSGWDSLAAIQNNRIFTFDDNLVSRPGPRLVDGLEALAKLIHPDLFE